MRKYQNKCGKPEAKEPRGIRTSMDLAIDLFWLRRGVKNHGGFWGSPGARPRLAAGGGRMKAILLLTLLCAAAPILRAQNVGVTDILSESVDCCNQGCCAPKLLNSPRPGWSARFPITRLLPVAGRWCWASTIQPDPAATPATCWPQPRYSTCKTTAGTRRQSAVLGRSWCRVLTGWRTKLPVMTPASRSTARRE